VSSWTNPAPACGDPSAAPSDARIFNCRDVTVESEAPAWESGIVPSSNSGRSREEASTASAEVVFSRKTPVAEFLESLLGGTGTSIEAALHQLSNPRLIRALVEASHRGVEVRLLLDRTKFEEAVSTFPALSNGRFSIRLLNGRLGPASRMHHKFALLDHRMVVTGSYNWTVGSDEQNFENLVILRGPGEAAAYRQEFKALWRLGTLAPQRAAAVAPPEGRGNLTATDPGRVADSAPQEKGFRIYLMRRGQAEPRGRALAGRGSAKYLTPEGRKRVSEITAGLAKVGFDVDGIVSSPARAALETAKLVGTLVRPEVPVETCNALLPGGSPEDAIRFLRERTALRRVLVVGHEPGLSRIAARLLDSGEDANLKLKKGGCCLLTFDELPSRGNGQLVWWLPPRVLRKLR
jgi:phosphohistidine phosphatase SixA